MTYNLRPTAYYESLLSISTAATQWAIAHQPTRIGQQCRAIETNTGHELWRGTIRALRTVPLPHGKAYVYEIQETNGTRHHVDYATSATICLMPA